jgi:hypothetical protein
MIRNLRFFPVIFLFLNDYIQDIEDDDFLQELYRIFIDFLLLNDQPMYVRVGAIFGLYTLYNTRRGAKIKVKIDDGFILNLFILHNYFN